MPRVSDTSEECDHAHQTLGEELANAITHGASTLLAVVGLVVMVVYASAGGDPWRIVTFSIFGTCLVLLYAASTCYHACRQGPLKRVLRVLDHSAIFLLIAGSYTPFMLVPMRGGWGWTIFGIVWGIALFGTIFKLYYIERYPLVSTILYLAMGWVGLLAIGPMFNTLPGGCMAWIIAGGMAYTSGVIFYMWERLPFNHAIWHLFVMAGSVCHFIAVIVYVLPIRAVV